MSKGHVLIATALVLLAGVIWFVFKPETCEHYSKRYNRAFAEALYGGREETRRWDDIRAERPEGC